ncbi:hypothetical protein L3Q82_010677 [Scortum barcoo]|uniref:Uncharacterized protein n=1 Tax=Scortum barcoo TaxID=214431 RepID=A0ACB8WCU8_9TELE|nr:hypothetical protein L3Q82_010677 [Scortum barcoo]
MSNPQPGLLNHGNIYGATGFSSEKISHESSGCGQCLLEYLLERLQVESCHVKLKVLKILVHLCGHGSNHFLTELRRNSTFIQQASVYSGPPDPIHGTALYQKVRNTAQEVARLLFTETMSTKSGVSPLNLAPPTMGMGSETSHRSGMQGFGYSPGKQGTGIRLHDNHYYRAVVAPSAPIEVAVPACAYNLPAHRPKAHFVKTHLDVITNVLTPGTTMRFTTALTQRCPGQIGGGWEETDSSNSSSHNSSQDIAANSRASVGSKSAGTGSQSGASRESSGDLSERVEALHLGDCGQEMALISRLTEGSRVFLSREESQHFIKECSTLNCEVVVELLTSKLQDPSDTVKMRALCAVSCLMTSDLLSLEQMFGATQRRLNQLSEGAPGPVANKATKILRQFEALMGGSSHTPRQDTANSGYGATTSDNQPPDHPSSPSSLALNQRDSSSELINDNEEKPSPIQQELAQNQMKVIQHSAETLETALVSHCQDLVKLYNKYTKEERRLLEEGFHPGQPGSLFQPITVHSDSDWIPAHPEEPQDFKNFYRDPCRKTPDASHSTIYIQTIGSFGEAGAQTDQYLEWLREYCQAFFNGLSVKLLPAVTVVDTGCSFRVNSNSHNLQILTGDLLRFLEKRKPRDAFCIVGITMIDLYPKESWNFVFGQASLTMGMGVFSFARYDDNFYSRSYAGRLKKRLQPKQGDYSVFEGYYTPPITSTLLLRSCKVMTHEIGHMFGIKHCQWLSCVMQGSNHLEESDRRPLDFCPICLRKLQFAIGFNLGERYKALLHWIEEDQSQAAPACQSLLLFPKPTEAFHSSRLWLRSCLDILEKKMI